MKKIIILFILSGCAVSFDANLTNDAGAQDSVHTQFIKEYVVTRYKEHCMKKCYSNLGALTYTGVSECESKCDSDTGFVLKTLGRAVAEGKEKDFNELFDQWLEE